MQHLRTIDWLVIVALVCVPLALGLAAVELQQLRDRRTGRRPAARVRPPARRLW